MHPNAAEMTFVLSGEAGLNIVQSETATVYRREGLGSDDVTLAPQGERAEGCSALAAALFCCCLWCRLNCQRLFRRRQNAARSRPHLLPPPPRPTLPPGQQRACTASGTAAARSSACSACTARPPPRPPTRPPSCSSCSLTRWQVRQKDTTVGGTRRSPDDASGRLPPARLTCRLPARPRWRPKHPPCSDDGVQRDAGQAGGHHHRPRPARLRRRRTVPGALQGRRRQGLSACAPKAIASPRQPLLLLSSPPLQALISPPLAPFPSPCPLSAPALPRPPPYRSLPVCDPRLLFRSPMRDLLIRATLLPL